MDLETNIFSPYPGQAGKDSCFTLNLDKLVNSPKFRHACEGRHPELFKKLVSRLRGKDAKGRIKTYYKAINFGLLIIRRVSNFGILI